MSVCRRLVIIDIPYLPIGSIINRPLESLCFHALFDIAADALLLVNDAGHVMLANSTALQLLGYTEKEITGLAVETLIPACYRTNHEPHLDIYFNQPEKSAQGNVRDLVALGRDGREMPVDIRFSPLHLQEQRCILITMIDAAQRRWTEKALRTSEERLQLAKRVAGLGVFDRDMTNGTLHLDERSRVLLGLDPEAAVNYENFLAVIHPEDRANRQAVLDRALNPASNGEYQTEFRIIRRNDGIERWLMTTGRVFFESGDAVRLVGIMQDITESKVMERIWQEHRGNMESLFKQQIAAQTASAIAHELNQPLAAISVYSEVALRALGSDTVNPETLNRALNGCVEQAQRAGKSLRKLLGFLQKEEFTPESLKLNDIVREALDMTQNNGFGGFYPTLELEQDLPPVLGNRIQIQKVLINLLRNGVEAMRKAGVPASSITVKVQTVRERNMAQVTVQDSGSGLDVETTKRVFEPFFTTKPSGIGMGLAISRSLIEANGGQLWFDPKSEAGATFHFTLPFAP
ncbi:MAG: PAS domain S-box protein [Methylophilaceae bacterium]